MKKGTHGVHELGRWGGFCLLEKFAWEKNCIREKLQPVEFRAEVLGLLEALLVETGRGSVGNVLTPEESALVESGGGVVGGASKTPPPPSDAPAEGDDEQEGASSGKAVGSSGAHPAVGTTLVDQRARENPGFGEKSRGLLDDIPGEDLGGKNGSVGDPLPSPSSFPGSRSERSKPFSSRRSSAAQQPSGWRGAPLAKIPPSGLFPGALPPKGQGQPGAIEQQLAPPRKPPPQNYKPKILWRAMHYNSLTPQNLKCPMYDWRILPNVDAYNAVLRDVFSSKRAGVQFVEWGGKWVLT